MAPTCRASEGWWRSHCCVLLLVLLSGHPVRPRLESFSKRGGCCGRCLTQDDPLVPYDCPARAELCELRVLDLHDAAQVVQLNQRVEIVRK